MLAQGTQIDVALTHDIRTDLPGSIEARVVSILHDSAGRGIPMIPQGTRILGRYETSIAPNQEALAARFERLIFPNGASLELNHAIASAANGRAGIPGDVDRHTLRTLVATAGIGLLGWGVDQANYREQQRLAANSNAAGALVVGAPVAPASIAAQAVGETGRALLQRQLARAPTIAVPKDTRFRVQLHHDLIFDPQAVWRHD
jgi:type IV secretion system protein TrbI